MPNNETGQVASEKLTLESIINGRTIQEWIDEGQLLRDEAYAIDESGKGRLEKPAQWAWKYYNVSEGQFDKLNKAQKEKIEEIQQNLDRFEHFLDMLPEHILSDSKSGRDESWFLRMIAVEEALAGWKKQKSIERQQEDFAKLSPFEQEAKIDEEKAKDFTEKELRLFHRGQVSPTKGASRLYLDSAEFSHLSWMNKTYSMVTISGAPFVMREVENDVEKVIELFKPQSFEEHYGYLNEFRGWKTASGSTPDDRGATMTMGQAWRRWSKRRSYDEGFIFDPTGRDHPNKFNLWAGFAVSPIDADCSIWLDHLKDVICDGDAEAAKYLLQWCAHMIQKPWEKPTVSVFIPGVRGAGKDSFIKPLIAALGRHAIAISGLGAITGRFNDVINNKILISCNEALVNGDGQENKLKTLISERELAVETKGVPMYRVKNYTRFIMTANSADDIKMGVQERRYLVVRPSAARMDDNEYWKRYNLWMENGGVEAVLDHLLKVDISDFNPYRAPKTRGLVDGIVANLGAQDKWVLEILRNPAVVWKDNDGFDRSGFDAANNCVDDNGRVFFDTKLIAVHYREYMERYFGELFTDRGAQTKVGHIMKGLRFCRLGDKNRGNMRYSKVLLEAQEAFAAQIGVDWEALFGEIEFDNEDW